jgi:hypothetical protein
MATTSGLELNNVTQAHDIERAVPLVNRGKLLWRVVVAVGGWAHA